MKLFDWALKIQGFPIDDAMAELAKLRGYSIGEFLSYQEAKKQEILNFHQKHNSFYRQFLQKKGIVDISNWENIPIITKADMQCPLEERLTEGYRLKNVFVNNTSGSSGVPFYFTRDKKCHALNWASTKECFGWHGIDFNTSLQARFYGIPLSGIKNIKEKLKDRLSKRVRFPVFNMEASVCATYLEKFKNLPFEYFNGYTNSLVLFARYCISVNVVLKNICPTLKVCITTSEVCTPTDREMMKLGFGVPVVNEYGASELDIIAFEDAEGNWKINEENLFLEVVDDNGKPVSDGNSGRIIVTALHNKSMPFIRYELGDLGVVLPGERCGYSRLLKELTGRTNDMALLPSGKKVPGLTFYYVSKSLLEKGGKIKELIIKQLSPLSFELEYVADEELTVKEKADVQQGLDTYLEPGLQLSFMKSESLERTRAGKLKNFQSMMENTGA